MKISGLDKKILLQLIKNSRQPVSAIAKKVGTTRQTVAKRIRVLKDLDIIRSFTVKPRPEYFDLSIKAFIFLKEEPKSELRKRNAEFIKKLPQVSEFYRIFGRNDAVVEVWTRDKDELTKLVEKIHRLKGIRSTETFIVHSTYKYKPEDPFIWVLKE